MTERRGDAAPLTAPERFKRTGYVFISYSREDAEMAKALRDALQRDGYEVWWDEELQCGGVWRAELEEALSQSAAVVVLWSPRAVVSTWVTHEASHAMTRGVYAPCRVELVALPSPYDLLQATDLMAWDGDKEHAGYRSLLARLDGLMPGLSPPAVAVRWLLNKAPTVAASMVAVGILGLLVGQVWLARRTETRRLKSILAEECENRTTGPAERGEAAMALASAKVGLAAACLRDALLYGADFQGADLQNADLRGANLSDADLRDAILRNANLQGAYLYGARLLGADLSGADLRDARLHRVDLRGARLSGSHLHGANLAGANLSTADLSSFIVAGASRSTVWPDGFDWREAGVICEDCEDKE